MASVCPAAALDGRDGIAHQHREPRAIDVGQQHLERRVAWRAELALDLAVGRMNFDGVEQRLIDEPMREHAVLAIAQFKPLPAVLAGFRPLARLRRRDHRQVLHRDQFQAFGRALESSAARCAVRPRGSGRPAGSPVPYRLLEHDLNRQWCTGRCKPNLRALRETRVRWRRPVSTRTTNAPIARAVDGISPRQIFGVAGA